MDGNNIVTLIFMAGMCALVGYCTYGDVWCKDSDIACTNQQAAKREEQDRIQRMCLVPKLVTVSPDGTHLYSINSGSECNEREVLFSSKGTATTHQECKQVGKIRTCKTIDDTVTNAD